MTESRKNEPKQKRDSSAAIENHDETVSLLTYESDSEDIPNPPNSPTKNESDNASILKRSRKLVVPTSFFGSYQPLSAAPSNSVPDSKGSSVTNTK